MTSPRTICFQLLIEVTKSLKYEIKFITSCKETLAEYTIKFELANYCPNISMKTIFINMKNGSLNYCIRY